MKPVFSPSYKVLNNTFAAAAARACGGRTAAVRPVPVSTPVYHDRLGSDVLRQDAFRGGSPPRSGSNVRTGAAENRLAVQEVATLYDVVRDGVYPPVEFVRGIPADLESDDFFDPRVRNVVVLDDLMTLASKDTRINDLFTEGSHHRNLSVIAIYQNLYFGKDPTQRRNCHYMVLFDNPDRSTARGHPGTTDVPGSIRTLPATIRRGHEKTTRISPRRRQTGDPRDGETAHERPDGGGGGGDDPNGRNDHGRSDRLRRMRTGLCTPPRTGGACVWQGGGGKGLQGEEARQQRGYLRIRHGRRRTSHERRRTRRSVGRVTGGRMLCRRVTRRHLAPTDDLCRQHGYLRWTGEALVAFHFPSTGPAEFFDSLGRSPEYYHRRFRNVLIANGPQYRFSTTQVQPGSSDTCGLYCVHFVKMRYRNISMEDIVKDFSSRDLMSNDDKLLALYE
ncbi:Hypothetical predicted protein [Mytilus galloprovincialis]|uniref:Uncharacterized protein n=1 Tax=Mytilus galloprovincialis TaxID=29158 RepID=A0A8B6DP98_MYTGA|nr:Hypothetical predicted protein [Mytilus galloprovincialis]